MAMPEARVLQAGANPPVPSPRPLRLNADPGKVEQGLARLVLSLVELLRQLMEREAIRQVDARVLTADQEEALGNALLCLAEKMGELKAIFGLENDDLNIDLGPLGRLY